MARGFCRCDILKGLEMGRLDRIIRWAHGITRVLSTQESRRGRGGNMLRGGGSWSPAMAGRKEPMDQNSQKGNDGMLLQTFQKG